MFKIFFSVFSLKFNFFRKVKLFDNWKKLPFLPFILLLVSFYLSLPLYKNGNKRLYSWCHGFLSERYVFVLSRRQPLIQYFQGPKFSSGHSDLHLLEGYFFDWDENEEEPFKLYQVALFSAAELNPKWINGELDLCSRLKKLRLSAVPGKTLSIFAKVEKCKL